MELLLYHLIDHIKENMPSLSLVDEDYGQLEAIDKEDVDTYPVTFPACSSTSLKQNGLISAVKARREKRRSTCVWSLTAMMTPTMVQERKKKRWRGLKWSKSFTRSCRATVLMRMGNLHVRSHASILGVTASRYMKCYTLLPLQTLFRKQRKLPLHVRLCFR